jgi:hypothetical protein
MRTGVHVNNKTDARGTLIFLVATDQFATSAREAVIAAEPEQLQSTAYTRQRHGSERHQQQ